MRYVLWVGVDLDDLLGKVDRADVVAVRGRVRALAGLSLRASMPGVRLGDRLRVLRKDGPPLDAEVVGFEDDDATLLPMGNPEGVGPGDIVESTGRPFELRCSDALLGRVLDGLGRPIDGGTPLEGTPWAIERAAPKALSRPRISNILELGIRSLDGLLTVGEGQRVGLFAGSGVGKSMLLGQIARQASADVFVACLIGERGREVREFLDGALGPEGLARGVVVCATSDLPPLVRLKAAYTATAVAEWFRDQGKRVVLLMDSVTRFARAARAVGLAAGETPARRGYPPSVFSRLAALLERSGTSVSGSITGFYTVLVEGSDMEEPIADEVRGILDGHIVLTRELGLRGRWPAVDVLQSLSRVMDSIADDPHRAAAAAVRQTLALYEEKRDLISLGVYKAGSDPKLDDAISRLDAIEAFLRQDRTEKARLDDTIAALIRLTQ